MRSNIKQKFMNKKIEIKYVYLNEDFKLVDANREFFVYFEKPGHDVISLEDFTEPSCLKSLKKFIANRHKSTGCKIFKFKKNCTHTRENIVSVFDSSFNGVKSICLKLIDLQDGIDFFNDYHSEETELLAALSLTDDCVFSYTQSTNQFRIVQFYRNRRILLYQQDIDDWREYIIQNGLVPENQIDNIHILIEKIKSCPPKIDEIFESAIRSSTAKILERLNFIGTRFVYDGEIRIVGKIMTLKDAEKVKNSKAVLEELQIDPLTKVYNKKTITAYAKKALSERTTKSIALIIMDLDHFKPVNDAYGHLAGDRVLEKTGEILQEIVGARGIVGRYGGDEFLILFGDAEDELVLRGFLRSILIKIRNNFQGQFDDINITTSIGCAVFPKNGTDYNELFRKADFCLYRAKDKGRNRYVFFRDDLHGELYKNAVAATEGLKYDDREIKELKYMSEFMTEVAKSPFAAIQNILNHMLITYNLDNITIYYGENMNSIYYCGKKLLDDDCASYVKSKDFSSLLNGRQYFRLDFPDNIPSEFKDFKNEMSLRKVKSTVQCIFGTPDLITGLVTFNRTKEASLWAEYEVNCSAMFASTVNLLPESTKVDFALYSKLKQ